MQEDGLIGDGVRVAVEQVAHAVEGHDVQERAGTDARGEQRERSGLGLEAREGIGRAVMSNEVTRRSGSRSAWLELDLAQALDRGCERSGVVLGPTRSFPERRASRPVDAVVGAGELALKQECWVSIRDDTVVEAFGWHDDSGDGG